MKKAGITEAKNNPSALIDGRKSGSPVRILLRDDPLPVTLAGEGELDGRLSRLARNGIVRPRRVAPSRAHFSTQPLRADAGASVVDALIHERREER